MAKRRAANELNRDNWDVEDEKEDPGTFQRASAEGLKDRVIKKAKRSLLNKDTSGVSPFAGFGGFSKSVSSPNPFSFLQNDVKDMDTSANVLPTENKKSENGNGVTDDGKNVQLENSKEKQTDSGASSKQKQTRSLEYYRQLQSLNESVIKWMQLHLDKNSCCDFTPVFNDYKKHLDTLNLRYPHKFPEISEGKSSSQEAPASTFEEAMSRSSSGDGFKLGTNIKNEDENNYGANFKSNTTNTSTFSFGNKKMPTTTSTMSSGPTTSFEEEAVPEKKPFQFSFGLKNAQSGNAEDSCFSKPFTFASAPVAKETEKEPTSTEEPEYTPPKNDFVAVKEEDAFYSKRCKLFYKKDDTYVERGIGTLHLKPMDGKTQLVIRADTNLGNILLNIVLSDSLPMSTTKNNVLLVCIPNPPLDAKKADSKDAVPMLIRVKTPEDAEELLELLNKHKS